MSISSISGILHNQSHREDAKFTSSSESAFKDSCGEVIGASWLKNICLWTQTRSSDADCSCFTWCRSCQNKKLKITSKKSLKTFGQHNAAVSYVSSNQSSIIALVKSL